ncbi:MAG: toll/interleukin-1 receptor domain-containing protein [Anaerolineales bacterium]
MPAKRSDVFISYRRLDKPFVRALDAALRADGREVWIDWEDIPPGSLNFQEDIQEGIDAAEAFILVLTPEFLQSEYTLMELEYAHRSSKRLVPILHKPVVDDNVPESISHINWVHILSEGEIPARYPQVRQALDTDHEHVETHTALIMRARDWERRGHDRSLLLRGNALWQAEEWLHTSQKQEKNPSPAELHIEYIEKSRQNANYWRRIQIAIGVVMAVIIGLAAFAAFQADEASDQRDLARAAQAEAEESEQTARALSLSSSALVALNDNDTDQAIALALLAADIDDDEPEVIRALAESAYEPGTRHVMRGHTDRVSAATFSADGSQMITGDLDGVIIVWDRETGAVVRQFSEEMDSSVRHLALAPDGWQVLAAYGEDALRTWDLNTGEVVREFVIEDAGRWLAAAFSPDGARIYAAGDAPGIHVWDTATGELLAIFPQDENALLDMAISPDESRALTAHADGRIIVWDIGAWLNGATAAANIPSTPYLRHSEPVTAVAWAPDSRHAVTGSEDNLLRYWDLDDGQVLDTLRGHADDVTDADISPDGRFVLSASGDMSLRVWDIADGQSIQRLAGHDDGVLVARFAPQVGTDSTVSAAVSGAIDEQVRLWDLQSGAQIEGYTPLGDVPGVELSAAALHPSGAEILVGTTDKTIQRVDVATGEVLGTLRGHTGAVLDITYNADGTRAVSGGADGFAIVWDTVAGVPLIRLEGHVTAVTGVDFLPDGARVVSGSLDRQIIVWDIASGEALQTLGGGLNVQRGHFRGISDVAVHPDGNTVVSVGPLRRVIFWNLAEGTQSDPIVRHTDGINAVVFSPDGAYMMTGGADNVVLVWDTATREVISRFEGHDGPIGAVAFSPDGRLAISGAGDETVRQWEVFTGAERRRFEGHDGPIMQVGYLPDRARAFSAGDDDSVRLWRNDALPGLVAWTLRNRFVRPLSPAECTVFRVEIFCEFNEP